MSASYLNGCFYIIAKVYILACLLLESAFENAIYKPAGSTVIQTFGGYLG